ncbi:MAG: AMP-binding protein, partial [Geodermatophilales bacterium]|nr:AMP-binding protein [Geodermatophilales bacterium]
MAEPVHTMVRRIAARCGERIAIEWQAEGQERRLSYRELGGEVARLAAALRMAGAVPGDRVAILGSTGAEVIAAILAALDLGCVFVPL